MRRRRFLALAAAALAPLPSALAEGETVEENVQRRLICQCGCNKVLAVCEMQGWAVPAKELIAKKAAQGLSADTIVQYFVDEYGVKILAAPPKRGFFLTAWLTPFTAILLGGIAIVVLLRQWARLGGRGRSGEAPAPLSSEQQALAARFEAELRERA